MCLKRSRLPEIDIHPFSLCTVTAAPYRCTIGAKRLVNNCNGGNHTGAYCHRRDSPHTIKPPCPTLKGIKNTKSKAWILNRHYTGCHCHNGSVFSSAQQEQRGLLTAKTWLCTYNLGPWIRACSSVVSSIKCLCKLVPSIGRDLFLEVSGSCKGNTQPFFT